MVRFAIIIGHLKQLRSTHTIALWLLVDSNALLVVRLVIMMCDMHLLCLLYFFFFSFSLCFALLLAFGYKLYSLTFYQITSTRWLSIWGLFSFVSSRSPTSCAHHQTDGGGYYLYYNFFLKIDANAFVAGYTE